MFKTETDERFHLWFEFRKSLEVSQNPLQDVVDFWDQAPRIPHNHLIDPYFDRQWPTPWEIIERNKYDDFTLSLMIGWSLLMTDRFKNTPIDIKVVIDDTSKRAYNVVSVNNEWVLNFHDHLVVPVDSIPSLYRVENVVSLKRPR
jgi:hypothetical protein